MAFRERPDPGMCFPRGAHRCLPRPPPALQSGNAGVRGLLGAETWAALALGARARAKGGGRGRVSAGRAGRAGPGRAVAAAPGGLGSSSPSSRRG